MKNLYKFLFVLVVSLLPINAAAADKFKAVTTFTVIADIAQNIAGDTADVVSITKPGAEIHNYQPTPRDIIKAQDADLILWNGLNLELWFEQFFSNLRDIPSIEVSQGVEPMSITQGPYSGKPNPHAWMSPNAAEIYINNIANAFATHDPENASNYFANAQRYKARLQDVIAPLEEIIDALPQDKKWLVSSEGAFSYLARHFDLQELYLWPINADQQGTPQQVRRVIDTVRAKNIPAVFSESTISANAAKQVARETDAIYGGVLYVDSLSQEDGPVPNYLALLQVTVETIAKALSQ